MTARRRIARQPLSCPIVLTACVAISACGWKVSETAGPGAAARIVVVMQNQDGDILGSKVFDYSAPRIVLSVRDLPDASGLSSKYIAVRSEPTDGTIGNTLVASTDTGLVSFAPPAANTTLRAVFMSTEHLTQAVMDCYYQKLSGPGTTQVGRALPGEEVPFASGVKVLDGDETVFTDVIDDVNAASVDRQGVVLGRLSWDRTGGNSRIKVGFSDPPTLAFFGFGFFEEGWYVLVNPRQSRAEQTMTALGGMLCPDSCGSTACGSFVRHLVDPAGGNARLSAEGVSLVRFASYFDPSSGMPFSAR